MSLLSSFFLQQKLVLCSSSLKIFNYSQAHFQTFKSLFYHFIVGKDTILFHLVHTRTKKVHLLEAEGFVNACLKVYSLKQKLENKTGIYCKFISVSSFYNSFVSPNKSFETRFVVVSYFFKFFYGERSTKVALLVVSLEWRNEGFLTCSYTEKCFFISMLLTL